MDTKINIIVITEKKVVEKAKYLNEKSMFIDDNKICEILHNMKKDLNLIHELKQQSFIYHSYAGYSIEYTYDDKDIVSEIIRLEHIELDLINECVFKIDSDTKTIKELSNKQYSQICSVEKDINVVDNNMRETTLITQKMSNTINNKSSILMFFMCLYMKIMNLKIGYVITGITWIMQLIW